jgi:hypothetical protein
MDGVDARCGDGDVCLGEGVPPTFMSVMTDLLVHLMEQLFKCSSIHCRCIYPIEQYMKTMKDYVNICTYKGQQRGKLSNG